MDASSISTLLALAVLLPRADADGSGAEGFGLCLAEAAGLGVPAVGARTGGVPEAVGPGLVVDDPDDLDRSLGAVRSFLDRRPGPAAHVWAAASHGVGRTCRAILRS